VPNRYRATLLSPGGISARSPGPSFRKAICPRTVIRSSSKGFTPRTVPARKTAKGARYAKKSAREDAAQTQLLAEQNWLLRRATPTADGPLPPTTVLERLAELDRFVASGVIASEERDQRRAEIIRGI
jgi:hypothetical protein